MFVKQLRLTVGLLTAFFLTGTSFAEQYRIDPGHSSVAFGIRHIVSRVQGNFTDFAGKIVYDSANPGQASVEATIQVASVDTDNQRRDDHLRSPDFFDAEKYPTIAFKSTKVESTDEKILKVTGDLSMHGTTKSVVMDVEVLGVGTHPRRGTPMAGFEARLKILRSEFEVNSWTDTAGVLGDEVAVTINIEAAGGGNQGGGRRGGRGGRGRRGGNQ